MDQLIWGGGWTGPAATAACREGGRPGRSTGVQCGAAAGAPAVRSGEPDPAAWWSARSVDCCTSNTSSCWRGLLHKFILYIVRILFFSDLDPELNIPDPVPDREDTFCLNMFFKLSKKFYSLAKGTNYKLLNTLLCIRIQYSCDI
jgi:hypothetical protein